MRPCLYSLTPLPAAAAHLEVECLGEAPVEARAAGDHVAAGGVAQVAALHGVGPPWRQQQHQYIQL